MARERYLVNQEESTIHANQITPKTGKEKRANWWFHNKWKLISGILLLAAFISFIIPMVTRVDPDYSIIMATEFGVPQELLEDLEVHFEQYADDRNGDKKVSVEIVHCLFNTKATTLVNSNEMQASFVRFAADAGAGESMIVIYDDASYDYLAQSDMEGFFGPIDDTDNEYYLWKELKSLESLEINEYQDVGATAEGVQTVLGELKTAVRAEQGDAFREDEVKEYREDSIEFYKRLMSGEKTAE